MPEPCVSTRPPCWFPRLTVCLPAFRASALLWPLGWLPNLVLRKACPRSIRSVPSRASCLEPIKAVAPTNRPAREALLPAAIASSRTGRCKVRKKSTSTARRNSKSALPAGTSMASMGFLPELAVICAWRVPWFSIKLPILIPRPAPPWLPRRIWPVPLSRLGKSSCASGEPFPEDSLSWPMNPVPWAYGGAWLCNHAPSNSLFGQHNFYTPIFPTFPFFLLPIRPLAVSPVADQHLGTRQPALVSLLIFPLALI